ncbi:DNA polymerase III subunit alpha, partial [Amycolatopsis jejuensis]|uniref:DNA polymerase III subunit alpha n=1 Tax=Amycolatopsis jejuensis TaxID=330084 RepID=UPI0005241DC2
EVPGAADSTLWIAERVESYEEVYTHKDRMPVFDVPEGHDEASWLHHEVLAGLEHRLPDGVPAEYRERAEYELEVITGKGFPGYFLITADLMAYAREAGIRVGPGRGSAAGSLVAYALRITNLDPLQHGLLFERFLNPERVSMPDIDMDFDDRRRGEMIRYATGKYGSDRIAQVITFGTIKTKAAIKDSARVHFGQPGYAIADRISKALPPPVAAKDIPLSGIVDRQHERYGEAAEVRALVETDDECKTIFDTARGLEGLIRNAGVHACAVIMSSEPLVDMIPLWQRDDGSVITGWDYPSCEAIGLLKMDFLGLRNLTVIGDAIDNIRANRGEDVDLDRLTTDDDPTFALLARGDSLGVFQLDGGAMRDLLRRMRPTGFEDIVAVNALYRPGPMAMNTHNNYADRKNHRQAIEPVHPQLEEPLREILAETYGLIVYQEQIMQIAQKVAKYSMGRADTLRRAMGKKKKEVLEKEFEGFHEGMLASGFSGEAVQALWDTILPFAGYAFNKSHAAGYALVGYWTAYLKANYTAEYMSLIKAGAFDSMGHTRLSMIQVHEDAVEAVVPLKRQEAMGQFDLFTTGEKEPAAAPLAHVKFSEEEWPRKQLLAHERDMLGLYVSGHPLDGAEGVLRKHAPKPIAAIMDNPPKEGELVVSGLITAVERRINKKGEPWAICTVEDLDASLEVLFFPKSYALCAADLVEDNAVLVKGRVNWREDKMAIFGAGLVSLDLTELGETPFVLHTRAEKVTLPVVLELKQTLQAHQGNTPVHLHVGDRRYALDGYSVTVTPALLGEVKTIRGITVTS